MAIFTFRLPDIGEGIAEAEIVAWHVKVGDRTEEDGKLADVMTDKAAFEMESPVAGIVCEIAGEVGAKIAIGSALVVIQTEDEEAATEPTKSEGTAPLAPEKPHAESPPQMVSPPSASEVVGSGRERNELHSEPSVSSPIASAAAISSTAPSATRILASPAVRARAKELGIDLAQVQALGGRIRHANLDAFLAHSAAHAVVQGRTTPTRADEEVKVIGMRRRIAESMAASKRHIPHFTYVDEIEVTKLEEMRADLNEHRGDRPKLTMLPLLIVALCKTLPEFPMLNARYDDEQGVVTRHGAVHLGMATQTPAGLMVPVIRNAHSRDIWQLAREIIRLAEAARTGKAKSEELSGSTITLTSLGPLGGIVTTPVINRPEVAILAPNKIVERPVFEGDHIRRAKLMNLSISCDHRVVDGWDAANYVQALKKLLETPVLLLSDLRS